MNILRKIHKEKLFLGIDIGGTTIKAGVINDKYDIINAKSIPTSIDIDGTAFAGVLIDFIKGIIAEYEGICSIGVGSPGVVDSTGTVRISPNIKALNNLPLKQILARSFDMPVTVDNDANAAAYAELKAGSGQDRPNFIYVTLGTGIGGAIIINKQIFRGDNGGAGEIGHTIIDVNSIYDKESNNIGHKGYRNGVLESFAGREAIIGLAKSILSRHSKSILNQKDDLDVIDISEAVSASDAAAIECFSEIGYYIGAGLASAMNLLGISLVIIGGGISNAHPLLFELIIETIKDRALPTIAVNAEIRNARFLNNAGITGAAMLGKDLI